MKGFDNAPAPFNTDCYVLNEDESVRGVAFQVSRTLNTEGSMFAQVTSSKVPQKFDENLCQLPPSPTDRLYVLPRTFIIVYNYESAATVANSILACLETICPPDTLIKIDTARMKISVIIPHILNVKFKLYRNNSDMNVFCRRDCGDWFVFTLLFSSIKKNLIMNKNLSIDSC